MPNAGVWLVSTMPKTNTGDGGECPRLLNVNVLHFIKNIFATLYTNWRASEASETLSGLYKFELVRVYICMEVCVP